MYFCNGIFAPILINLLTYSVSLRESYEHNFALFTISLFINLFFNFNFIICYFYHIIFSKIAQYTCYVIFECF